MSAKKLIASVFIIIALVAAIYAFRGSADSARLAYLRGLNGKGDFVQAGQIRTHYYEAGEGPAVVLIHGAGEGGVTWYPIFEKLSNRFRVIAPDVVGYGESDKPDAPYDAEYFSKWLLDFLDAKNVSHTRLVGVSQGGAIATHFAARYPERVEKLVLVDSAGFGPMPSEVFIAFVLANTFPSYPLAVFSNRYLVYNTSKADDRWTRYGVEVLRMPGGKNVFWQGRGKIAEQIPESILNTLPETLIIWGSKDVFFPLEYAYKAQKQIPGAKLVVLNQSGHLPFFDAQEVFVEAVSNFLG